MEDLYVLEYIYTALAQTFIKPVLLEPETVAYTSLVMGRTATHVANSYGYTIYASCDAERQRLVGFSKSSGMGAGIGGAGFNVSSSMAAKFDVNIIKAGFTKILPGDFVKFQVDCRGTRTVYISIYTKVNNSVENICENLPKREDYSVMVTESGQVVDTKYGNIWKRK